MTSISRALRAFGRFWWEFLVGDAPEVVVAVLVIVGAALALRHQRWLDVVVLPVLAVVTLVGSPWRGRRRR